MEARKKALLPCPSRIRVQIHLLLGLPLWEKHRTWREKGSICQAPVRMGAPVPPPPLSQAATGRGPDENPMK